MLGFMITILMKVMKKMFDFNLMRTFTTKIKEFRYEINEYNNLSKKLLKYCNKKIDKSSEPILHIPFHTLRSHLNIDFNDQKLKKLISIITENNRHIAQLGRYVIIIKL